MFFGPRALTLSFKIPHTFSIGFKSGLCSGQGSKSIDLSLKYSLANLEVCFGHCPAEK
jgi:hypothetical protein